MSEPSEIAGRVREVRRRITAAAERGGRDPSTVTLIGASKQQPVGRLAAAWEAGLRCFGENRVQEAEAKRPQLPDGAEWHLLGPLQSNKAKLAVRLFEVIHSVDRGKIIRALERHAGEAAAAGELAGTLPLACFAEINLGAEETKHGFSPTGLVQALSPFEECDNLELLGLMAIPPPGDTPEASRRWFVQLRELAGEVAASGRFPGFRGALSMGMSHDFEVAVEEGATHVRVGTALFGPRPR